MSLSPRGKSSSAAEQALGGEGLSRRLSSPKYTESRNPSSSSSSSLKKPPPSPGGAKLRRRSPSTQKYAQPPLWSSGGGDKASSKTSSSNSSAHNHPEKEARTSNSAYLSPPSPISDSDLRRSQLYQQQQNVIPNNGPTVVELAAIGQGSSTSSRISTSKSSRRSTPSSSHLESSFSGLSRGSITIQTDPGPVRRYQLSSLQQANFTNPTATTTTTLNAEPLTIEIDVDSPHDGHDGICSVDNSTEVSLESNLIKDNTSTLLHALCSDATTPMDLWNGTTLVTIHAASQSDSVGRLPLHCLSQNKAMAEFIAFAGDSNEQQHETAEFTRSSLSEISPSLSVEQDKSSAEGLLVQFVLKILRVYPSSMISQDGMDQIPFEGILSDWVQDAHEPDSKDLQIGRSRTTSWDGPSAFWNRSVATIAGNNTTSTFGNPWGSSSNHPDLSGTEGVSSCIKDGGPPPPPSGQLHTKGDLIKNNNISPKTAPAEWDRFFPIRTRLTAQAYFALKMLSAIVDYLDHRLRETTAPASERVQSIVQRPVESQGATGANEGACETLDLAMGQLQCMTLADVQSEIIHSVASIPHLLKVLLLMDDDEQRRFVFSTTIVKRVLASKDSIGTWLTGMLQSDDRYISNRAIAYLKMVSEITQIEKTSMPSWPSRGRSFSKFDEEDEAPCNLTQLCQKASRLQGFVPSLLSLSEKQVEEASTTRLVEGVLDRIIATPFCSIIVMSDAIFLTILIACYRAAINHLILGSAPDKVMQYIYVANSGIFYFIIRELGKAVSLCTITSRARTYFLSFWNLIDLLSTILVLISVVAIRSHLGVDQAEAMGAWRNTLAVTTGFLWLRVLSFLKGINMQLATFVLAILQITRDVVWFCVILVALILAFGQMFFTLLAPNTCSTVEDGNISRECNQSEYYLKAYSLLISQEFEREDFTSAFSVFLAVIYSFLVVLVLLNVLIAVASDSYEKCLFRSHNLFGRARVMMIAELVSFQNLLRRSGDRRVSATRVYKSWWSSDAWFRGWSRGSVIFLALSSVVIILWVLAETVGYFSGPGYGNVVLSLASIFINVALFLGIMLFLSTSGETDAFHDEKGVSSVDVGWREFPQRIMLRLLGSSGGSLSAGTSHDSWKGRLLFLRDELKRISDETKADTDDKIKALEITLCERINQKLGTSSKNSLDEATLRKVLDALHAIQASVKK